VSELAADVGRYDGGESCSCLGLPAWSGEDEACMCCSECIDEGDIIPVTVRDTGSGVDCKFEEAVDEMGSIVTLFTSLLLYHSRSANIYESAPVFLLFALCFVNMLVLVEDAG
jgi:hypothetical protein